MDNFVKNCQIYKKNKMKNKNRAKNMLKNSKKLLKMKNLVNLVIFKLKNRLII